MSKKIVAIGGGENGRISSNGEQKPYETLEIDKEIVRLAEKDNPNFLLLAHSQIPFGEEAEERYYNVIKKLFEKLGCNVKWLKVSELRESLDKAKNYVEWADIIYEGGGATDYMLKFWKETGFDVVLKEAWESGKVMTGEEFIQGVLKRAGQFNTFQELFTAYGTKVDPTVDYKAEREKTTAVDYDKQYEERVAQISQELLREEMARQMFTPGTTKEDLEKARKLIEAQMTGVDIDVVEDNSITQSSGIKR